MIDNQTKLETWDKLAYEAMGGEDVARALWRYHVEHESIRSIAESLEIPHVTLNRQMTKARTLLRRLGVMPVGWENANSVVNSQATE